MKYFKDLLFNNTIYRTDGNIVEFFMNYYKEQGWIQSKAEWSQEELLQEEEFEPLTEQQAREQFPEAFKK